MMKLCSVCKIEKPLDEFWANKKAKYGVAYLCKECTRARKRKYYHNNKEKYRDYNRVWNKNNRDSQLNTKLKMTYGITLEQKEEILHSQDWKCVICSKEIPLTGRDSAVDHCHETDKVRGILCKDCNTGLGHFKDNQDNLLKAVQYLRETEEGL